MMPKQLGIQRENKMNLNLSLTYYTKTNSMNHELKYKTIKQKRIGGSLWYLGIGKEFLDLTPKA